MKGISYLFASMLLAVLSSSASAQQYPGEVSWQLQHNAGGMGKFVQIDELGQTFVLEANSNSTSTINVYDAFGDLVGTRPLAFVATGFAIDPYADTEYVSHGQEVDAFYLDGETASSSDATSLLNFNNDGGGRAVAVWANTDEGTTDVSCIPNGPRWKLSFVASSALVDSQGNVLVINEAGTFNKGTQTISFYSETGQQLWTRTYNHTSLQGQFIGGFVEDPDGVGYLIINGTGDIVNSVNYHIEAINPSDGGTDLWQTTDQPQNVTAAAVDDSNLYLELSSGQLFAISSQNTGNLQAGQTAWFLNQPADQLAINTGGVIVGVYNSTANAYEVLNFYVVNGNRLSEELIPCASTSDEGMLIGGENIYATYVGATGGSNSAAVVARLIFAGNLNRVVLPSSVVGGSSIPGDFVLTEADSGGVFLTISSNFSKIVTPPSNETLTSLSTTVPFPTSAIDTDTVVSITTTEPGSGVRRYSTVKVLTAEPASIKPTVSTIVSGATTMATITLTGPAGPSGKTVLLSSNEPSALSLPASISISPGKSTATVTLTAHTVTKNTVVTLTAKIGTQDAFGSITVEP